MAGVDVRRTSQSPFDGPPAVASTWSYTAAAGAAVNMQAVVTSQGAFFGTWGLPRKDSALTPDQWDKSDGRYYGLSPAGAELFAPLRPALVPGGYLDAARPRVPRDDAWCPGTPYHVTVYNGTIEGTACVDPVSGFHYVGRGDGRLLAVNPATGAVAWSFATFNPQDAGEDTGGEIVGGPVLGPGRIVYFATAGLPWPSTATNPCYETSAVYAVDSSGTLVWRYPSTASGLDNWLLAPPALSPDGRTLYVGTFAGDVAAPGRLIALDLTQPAAATDAQRLRWEVTLRNASRPSSPAIWVRHIAVGSDGRIYIGGAEAQFFGSSVVVIALNTDGAFAWTPAVVEPQGYPAPTHWTGGLALRETGTPVLYVTSTHNAYGNGTGGALIAMNPATGAVLGVFDPESLVVPAVGGLTGPMIGANGTVYAGVRGRHPAGASAAVRGRMLALAFTGSSFSVLWDFTADGQLDWVTPAIGADGALYFGSSDDRINFSFTNTLFDPWFGPTEVPADTSPRFYGIR